MQRLLHEGGQDLSFQDECVLMPACPNFRFFPVPLARKPVSIRFGVCAVGAAARAAGGMSEYGEYPKVPSRLF